jgi:non-ribosomal peptide synthetase component E (peptide arylation enzyme)
VECGYFYIVDRLKDQINTAGFKVWPREVEEVMSAHPSVKMVAVIGVDNAYGGKAVKVFVVLKEKHPQRVSKAGVLTPCQGRPMPDKMRRRVESRDEFPPSAAGKMLRRLLRGGGGLRIPALCRRPATIKPALRCTYGHPHSWVDASRAPSAMARILAHTISGSTW